MSTPALADLPEPVRARIVALTAEVLPDVPKLPPAVRRVAGFAPARRARLGAGAIAEALADEELRERVGTQVSARPAPDPADAATDAAMSWLTRPEDWEAGLADALRRVGERSASGEDRVARELERLRSRLAAAEQSAREQRAALKAQVEEVKAENTTLRRKLGDTRSAERAARVAADDAADATRAATDRAAALERENRRLRGQVEQLEAQVREGRREARSERDEATLRARILLETVIDAASGLRRELALPQVGGAPGDRVEADVAAAGQRMPAQVGLEHYLAMPRARLIVDGYNVSKAAWPSSPLEAQRLRLMSALAPLVARTGAETTVVFDAADTDHRPPVNAPRGVRVLFSPRGVIADDVIRDLVAAEPEGRVVVVVTADQAVGRDVTRSGARVVAPEALLDLVAR